MKKIATLGLVLLLTASLLVGCGGGIADDLSGEEDIRGTEAAKLLLAGERLDASTLKNGGSIFENGVEVFRNLADIARENLIRVTYSGENATPELLSDGSARSTAKQEYLDGSSVEINGDIYKFQNFAEYSNSYSYFENITSGVISSAEMAAELIDMVKTNVRILDTWVSIDTRMQGEEYYLHVEEDAEILYQRYFDQVQICRRTKTDDGKNKYELFNFNTNAETRLIYIPGELCEYSLQSLETDFNHDFVATNTKGFWEVIDIGRAPEHYNVSCMVLKDNICYDAFYAPAALPDSQEVKDFALRNENDENVYLEYLKEYLARPMDEKIPLLKVISADRGTDLLNFSTAGIGAEVELALYGFNGVAHIEVEASADRVAQFVVDEHPVGKILVWTEEDLQGTTYRYYHLMDSEAPVLVTQNGARLRAGDTFCDGKIVVRTIFLEYFNKLEGGRFVSGYAPKLALYFASDDHEERMALLREFLDEVGLSCRRDLDYIESGITQAYAELTEFIKHHTWQGCPIETSADIARGFEVRDEKFRAWRELYNSVKDAEIVVQNSAAAALKMQFPAVTVQGASSITADGLHITVSALALQVTDTLLFVENENYALHFAVIGKGDRAKEGLAHIALEGGSTAVFTGESEFTVAQQVSFTVPVLAEGEYTLVSYIATTDGIRVSKYIPVSVSEVKGATLKVNNLTVSTEKASDGTLTVSCKSNSDVLVELSGAEYSYEAMHRALAAVAYEYGFADADAVLEVQNADGSFTALSGTESALDFGVYRLRYGILNGAYEMHGYIIATYAAQ